MPDPGSCPGQALIRHPCFDSALAGYALRRSSGQAQNKWPHVRPESPSPLIGCVSVCHVLFAAFGPPFPPVSRPAGTGRAGSRLTPLGLGPSRSGTTRPHNFLLHPSHLTRDNRWGAVVGSEQPPGHAPARCPGAERRTRCRRGSEREGGLPRFFRLATIAPYAPHSWPNRKRERFSMSHRTRAQLALKLPSAKP